MQAPIAEVETHFLDDKDDLVVFEDDESSYQDDRHTDAEANGEYGEYGDLSTPMPREAYGGAEFEGAVGAEGAGQSTNGESRTSSPTVPGFDESLRTAKSEVVPVVKSTTPAREKSSATTLSPRLDSFTSFVWGPLALLLLCWYVATH